MQIRELNINKIVEQLSIIKSKVSLRNSLHLLDINIHGEEFFKALLNKIFGYDLRNLNHDHAFTESIDLGDSNNGVAFQVTSNKSKKKVDHTIKLFYENGLYKDYPILKILLIGDKPKRSEDVSFGDFKFNMKTNIIDLSDLVKSIEQLDTSKIQEIAEWIEGELQHNVIGSYIPPTQSDFDKCFKKFLNSDIDPNTLLFKAQPNIADCREVFSDEYYMLVHQLYSVLYFSMLGGHNTVNDQLRDKDIYRVKFSTLSDIQNGNHNLPGGMSIIAERNAFRPGKLHYYSISFTKRDSEHGISFNIWVFLNGRWVFFPKPWHMIGGLHKIKSHKTLKIFAKILKVLRGRNYEIDDQAGVFATVILLSELGKK